MSCLKSLLQSKLIFSSLFKIKSLLDDFSWGLEDDLAFYKPYNKFLPSKHARLLSLWGELIRHEERKQEFGSRLTIIGFDVDPNSVTITMSNESR